MIRPRITFLLSALIAVHGDAEEVVVQLQERNILLLIHEVVVLAFADC